ncbi:MAG TPA: hypothetical protein VFE48_22405 [Methylomirabilota bacterium]|nr:hypothetical protein [Methylomirabilota bacterium]
MSVDDFDEFDFEQFEPPEPQPRPVNVDLLRADIHFFETQARTHREALAKLQTHDGRPDWIEREQAAVDQVLAKLDELRAKLPPEPEPKPKATPGRPPTHGQAPRGTKHPIYRAWDNMIQRCTNPNHKDWKKYGAVGVTVCERWRTFANFLEDTIESWRPHRHLARKNDTGNYEPGNAWFVPRAKNRPRNRRKIE